MKFLSNTAVSGRNIFFPFVLLTVALGVSCAKENPTSNLKGVLVINELMSKNTTTVKDQDGQYDDWIELYNLSDKDIDLSGYYLSDSKKEPTKWSFPKGTKIGAKSYLIIWADKDLNQKGLHADFKLSSEGEMVILSAPDKAVIDEVTFGAQTQELSYARVPDGTGSFTWTQPTFNGPNK